MHWAVLADMMTGWVMKAFNVTHFDDRRLCYKRVCDESLIAFQWDHAVRDLLDPEYRTATICCEEEDRCQDIDRRCASSCSHGFSATGCHAHVYGVLMKVCSFFALLYALLERRALWVQHMSGPPLKCALKEITRILMV